MIFGPVREGGNNLSHLRDPEIDAEMKRILEMEDANEANAAWAALDKKIMETITPLVPDLNDVGTMLHGSRIGGAEIDPQSWTVSPEPDLRQAAVTRRAPGRGARPGAPPPSTPGSSRRPCSHSSPAAPSARWSSC